MDGTISIAYEKRSKQSIIDSEEYKKKIIKEYKSKIIPGIKNFHSLIKDLKEKIDLLEVVSRDIDKIFWVYGVMEKVKTMPKHLDHLIFKIFKVINNSKSRNLYRYAYNSGELETNKSIFIVFEKSTRLMVSNCTKLNCKLVLYKGISKYDYENNTPCLIYYLTSLKSYLEIYKNQ